jgi:hypothetical protein
MKLVVVTQWVRTACFYNGAPTADAVTSRHGMRPVRGERPCGGDRYIVGKRKRVWKDS